MGSVVAIPPAGMISSLGDRGPCEVPTISYFGPQILTCDSFFFNLTIYFRDRKHIHKQGE